MTCSRTGCRRPAGGHSDRLTKAGPASMDDFEVEIAFGSRLPLIRYCVDLSEQRHYLAGRGVARALRAVRWQKMTPDP